MYKIVVIKVLIILLLGRNLPGRAIFKKLILCQEIRRQWKSPHAARGKDIEISPRYYLNISGLSHTTFDVSKVPGKLFQKFNLEAEKAIFIYQIFIFANICSG